MKIKRIAKSICAMITAVAFEMVKGSKLYCSMLDDSKEFRYFRSRYKTLLRTEV